MSVEGNLVVTDCKLYTGRQDIPSARGLVIEEGMIVYVGSELQAKQKASRDARRISFPGSWGLPGLDDAHVHLTRLHREGLDLSSCRNVHEILSSVKTYAEKSSEIWVLGRGWDQEKLNERRPPTRRELDEIVRDRPVLLYRVCGHLAVANSMALEQADLSGLRDDLFDAERGWVRERAVSILSSATPAPPLERLAEEIEEDCISAAESGLCTAQVILSVHSRVEAEAIKLLLRENRLKFRLRLWFPVEQVKELRGIINDEAELVKFAGAKIFLDGSLGGRTAALFEDYSDAPGQKGVLNYSNDELLEILDDLARDGIRPAMHAIGDRAVQQALKAVTNLRDRLKRPRIEHASLTTPNQIEQMRELGIQPVVQPHFAISDWWARQRLGTRVDNLYQFKAMIQAGLNPAGSSDAPVEPLSPLTGIWAAVVNPISQGVNIQAAIDLYTKGSAMASGEEASRGQLREGMRGDLVLLSNDLLSVEPAEIRQTDVLMTVINGELVVRPKWLTF